MSGELELPLGMLAERAISADCCASDGGESSASTRSHDLPPLVGCEGPSSGSTSTDGPTVVGSSDDAFGVSSRTDVPPGDLDSSGHNAGQQYGADHCTVDGTAAPIAVLSPKISSELINPATSSEQVNVPVDPAAIIRRRPGVAFSAHLTDYEVVVSVAEARGWRVYKSEEKAAKCNILWIDKAEIEDWLRRVEPWMRVNHFPGMNQALARKTRLARNMARMQRMFPKDYKFLPPTWLVPDHLGSLERRFDSTTGESKSIFIVKPDHQCQGRGIFLTTSLERIKQAVVARDETVVVQQYLSRPMLIDGLKFDLRLYFLVGGVVIDGGNALSPRLFLFRDGLVRLCTQTYEAPTPETMDKRCMHLTNYAVNKLNANFVQNSGDTEGASGSKRSLRWFLNYVENQHGEEARRKLWSKLAGLCVKTALAVYPNLEAEMLGTFPKDLTGGRAGCRCFEVLGMDVMLDQKRKPYLIEVNHLPSFQCDSPLDQDIKSRVLHETLDLTCSDVTPEDQQIYREMTRQRAQTRQQPKQVKERGYARCRSPSPVRSNDSNPIASPSGVTDVPSASPLDLETYGSYERVYPATSLNATKKQAALYDTILAKCSEVFRPVIAQRRLPKTEGPADGPDTASANPASGPISGGAAGPSVKQSQPPRPPRPPAPAVPPGLPLQQHPRATAGDESAPRRSRSVPGARCAPIKERCVEQVCRMRSSSARAHRSQLLPSLPLRALVPMRTISMTL